VSITYYTESGTFTPVDWQRIASLLSAANRYAIDRLRRPYTFTRPPPVLAPERPGDGLKRLRAQVRSLRPISVERPMVPRFAGSDARRKGRPRRGRLPRRNR
jgi:hypothetical protein